MPMDEFVPEGERPVYSDPHVGRPPANGDFRFTLDSSCEIFHDGEWIPAVVYKTPHMPHRGSDVETWIINLRDSYADRSRSYWALDELLDDYQLRADQGLMLADDHTDDEVSE
jgi:hypothetical protein